jgi:hypothetical protein
MAVNPVSVWRLSPEELKAYKPGQDLGKPDEIIQPGTLVKPGSKSPPIPKTAPNTARNYQWR